MSAMIEAFLNSMNPLQTCVFALLFALVVIYSVCLLWAFLCVVCRGGLRIAPEEREERKRCDRAVFRDEEEPFIEEWMDRKLWERAGR